MLAPERTAPMPNRVGSTREPEDMANGEADMGAHDARPRRAWLGKTQARRASDVFRESRQPWPSRSASRRKLDPEHTSR